MKKFIIPLLLTVAVVAVWMFILKLHVSPNPDYGTEPTLAPFQLYTGIRTDATLDFTPYIPGIILSIISWIFLLSGFYYFNKMPKYLKVLFILGIIAIPILSSIIFMPTEMLWGI